MAIESAKITFSSIGVTSSNSPRTVIKIPRVSIRIAGRKTAKTGYLFGKNKSGLSRFGKNNYIDIAACKELCVIITDAEYITIGEDATEHGSISIFDAGDIVDFGEDGFFCFKDGKIVKYDINCSVTFSRDATEEEISQLNA